MKQFLIIHPFLFAIAPILFLFAYNIDEVSGTDLILPLLVAITGTLILMLSLRLITKDYNKIAIITSTFLILFFSYGHIRDLIYSLLTLRGVNSDILIGPVTNFSLGPLWVLLFGGGAFLIIRAHRDFSTSTKFLNIVAITLVAISLINIGIYEISMAKLMPETTNGRPTSVDSKDSDNLPDIYYIILDAYKRQDVLKEVFDYDNSEFINFLTDKGFYVASNSTCNYMATIPSLSSSLNMRYINYITDTVDTNLEANTILREMIQDNEVSRFLKSRGYRYIFVDGGFFADGMDKYADVYRQPKYRIGMTNFVSGLIHTTALAPFALRYIGTRWGDFVLYSFDTLANLPNYKEPVFVFTHNCCTHGPFVFDCEGNRVKGGEGTYVDAISFTNKRIKGVIDEILSKSDVAPIIILQGDHGNEHKILNAYYFPREDYDLLYETISPVNSFRIVFNLYFDADYELLEDESRGETKK